METKETWKHFTLRLIAMKTKDLMEYVPRKYPDVDKKELKRFIADCKRPMHREII